MEDDIRALNCDVEVICTVFDDMLGVLNDERQSDIQKEQLFKHVEAVIHHGGAGTTACGLLYGCATAVVPFFGE